MSTIQGPDARGGGLLFQQQVGRGHGRCVAFWNGPQCGGHSVLQGVSQKTPDLVWPPSRGLDRLWTARLCKASWTWTAQAQAGPLWRGQGRLKGRGGGDQSCGAGCPEGPVAGGSS